MRELVQLAEQGGFEIAWAAEHHTIELMAGPNPFTFLMDWAAHTSRIRLGTAVVVARIPSASPVKRRWSICTAMAGWSWAWAAVRSSTSSTG
jgi:alkanesulfonate monooxygenase SsuD/methylene tetrahydromethanopterin reductase-like flavin-dependent oxidoreductase (luciferase family)